MCLHLRVAITWRSVTQIIIVRTTMGSEFIGLDMAKSGAKWLKKILNKNSIHNEINTVYINTL